jgi:hypothetical protein
MRTLLLTLICFGLTAAHANPVTVKATDREIDRALHSLVERFEEPVGYVATTDLPKLGLKKGDVVRSVNGTTNARSWGMSFPLEPTEVHLQVLRGSKTLYVRVAVQVDAREWSIERQRFKDLVERNAASWLASDSPLREVTKSKKPSGVLIGLDMTWLELGLGDGLIVRKVDGKPVATRADLIAELKVKSVQSKIVFDVERGEQRFTLTLHLEGKPQRPAGTSASAPSNAGTSASVPSGSIEPQRAEAPPSPTGGDLNDEETKLIASIKNVNDTTYEIPAAVRDGVLDNPVPFAKGARVVPAVKNGKPDGFKMYAIRPSSIYAALGFTNGDTIHMINGMTLDSADAALDAYTKLRNAKRVTVEITRRGKPITLTYTFK